jgi:hypothetical protein
MPLNSSDPTARVQSDCRSPAPVADPTDKLAGLHKRARRRIHESRINAKVSAAAAQCNLKRRASSCGLTMKTTTRRVKDRKSTTILFRQGRHTIAEYRPETGALTIGRGVVKLPCVFERSSPPDEAHGIQGTPDVFCVNCGGTGQLDANGKPPSADCKCGKVPDLETAMDLVAKSAGLSAMPFAEKSEAVGGNRA